MQRTEGVILSATPFQEYDQIVKVYTPAEGLITFVCKRSLTLKGRQGAIIAPLSRIEFDYVKGKGDFYKCKEICLLNPHLALRQSLQWLRAGCDLLQVIMRSQEEQKPAINLYKLLIAYLEKIPLIPDPLVLGASMRLKVMRHDGLYRIGTVCDRCEAPIRAFHAMENEVYCPMHAPLCSIPFNEEEIALMEQLAFFKTFGELKTMAITPSLNVRVNHFFEGMVRS